MTMCYFKLWWNSWAPFSDSVYFPTLSLVWASLDNLLVHPSIFSRYIYQNQKYNLSKKQLLWLSLSSLELFMSKEGAFFVWLLVAGCLYWVVVESESIVVAATSTEVESASASSKTYSCFARAFGRLGRLRHTLFFNKYRM